MGLESDSSNSRTLKMATEDQYRKKAAFYRNSKEYNKMVNLYPVLQTSIEDCKNEELLA